MKRRLLMKAVVLLIVFSMVLSTVLMSVVYLM